MKISLVINCDSRPQNDSFGGSNLMGVVNEDFLFDGVWNKVKFFDGFEKEVIVYIDQHEFVPEHLLHEIHSIADTVIVRQHTNEPSFNDWNYLRALSFVNNEIVIHIDQDTAMFANSKEEVHRLLGMLDNYEFISYPSYWTPYPVIDPSFDHIWCSTRFFMCLKKNLDLPEIIKCANDYNYWCDTYPVARKCPWLEHWIGSIAKYRNQKVFYPPMELDRYAIFSWGSYKSGTLPRLNMQSYEDVVQWIKDNGNIQYPCDIHVK